VSKSARNIELKVVATNPYRLKLGTIVLSNVVVVREVRVRVAS
jgi:hypothetical protein